MRAGGVIIGVISDTHGLLRPEALAALRGADRIIHAGDIGGPEMLAGLEERDGVLWFNPGSAGPRRFSLPIVLGRLIVDRRDGRAAMLTLAA